MKVTIIQERIPVKLEKEPDGSISFTLDEENAQILKPMEETIGSGNEIPNLATRLGNEYGKSLDILKAQLYGDTQTHNGFIIRKTISSI